MRLRALVAMAIVFSLAPAVPAFAGSPPAPAPSATPAPATTENPPAPDSLRGGQDPSAPPKLEAGLGVDTDGARVIVEVAAPAEAAPVAGEARLLPDAQVILEPPDTSFIVVQGTGESLTRLAEDPRVRSIRRDRAYFPTSLASGLQVIGADRAHAIGVTGKDQTIAIIDTGIDADHPDLAGSVVDQECFSVTDESEGAQSLCPNGDDSDSTSADAKTSACLDGGVNLCDHGTHVAGIAHAVAPDADIVAIQVFSRINDCEEGGACLTAYESSLLLALDRVAELKDTTAPNLVAVNLSLGGGLYEGACDAEPELEAMKERVEVLRAKGVAVVAAAGNEGALGAGAPGCLSGAVTVGATDDGDRVPYWSNYGSGTRPLRPRRRHRLRGARRRTPALQRNLDVHPARHRRHGADGAEVPRYSGRAARPAQGGGPPDRLRRGSTPRLDLGVAIAGGYSRSRHDPEPRSGRRIHPGRPR